MPWLNAHPEVAFIIAPHEFNETRLEALRNRFSDRVLLLSEWIRIIKKARKEGTELPAWMSKVRGIIVDSFGKLSTLYRFADVAYIGGGFGAGIHNLNEAAVYGMPVIFGPNHQKFKEASDLIACGGGFTVDSRESFDTAINPLMLSQPLREKAGEAAGAYIRSNLGATDRIYSDLFPQ